MLDSRRHSTKRGSPTVRENGFQLVRDSVAEALSMAKEKLLIIATHAADDPERATIPFVLANAAMATEMSVTIVLQAEGVRLGVIDQAKRINADAFPPLQNLMNDFSSLGGVLMVCVPCLKARKIQESQIIPGTRLVAAGTIVAEVASANKTLTY